MRNPNADRLAELSMGIGHLEREIKRLQGKYGVLLHDATLKLDKKLEKIEEDAKQKSYYAHDKYRDRLLKAQTVKDTIVDYNAKKVNLEQEFLNLGGIL